MELHYFRGNPVPGVAPITDAAPHRPAQMALLLNHLASLGYGIVAREDNTGTNGEWRDCTACSG